MNTVFISGTNRGIGLELTRQYLEARWRVIATCRDPEAATELQHLKTLHPAALRVHALNVTDGNAVRDLANALHNEPLDVLINNAGVLRDSQGLEDMDYEAWEEAFAVNTIAPFRLSQALLPNLRLSSRPRIVTLSSSQGTFQVNHSGLYAYRSSKAAVNKVMHTLANDLKGEGIIVCLVHPGWVQTSMGGPNANVPIEVSARGLIRLIEDLRVEQTGRLFRYTGEEMGW